VVRVRCLRSLASVDPEAWDRLDHGPSPFLEYGFLRALEDSGSVGRKTGWYPHYLLAEEGRELVGAVAAYIKTDSYGEYIFDWSFARASERAGVSYYPKLVIAAPVTPATGRRILVSPGADRDHLTEVLASAALELADRADCSSVHWLFTTEDESDRLSRLGFAPRSSFQFHWRNREYGSFDDFLAQLASRKRKQVRRERRLALEQIDRLEMIPGTELAPAHLEAMDRFYRRNVYLHGGFDYLRPGFFERLVELMPERVLLCAASRAERVIAGAIFLETERGLYGRYWGCDEQVEFLHFEVACYAGIERCIERGVPLFEAGAQGEHKLLRGFEPARTFSAHSFRHPELDRAIRAFLAEEAEAVSVRMRLMADHGPYRRDGSRR
jgi:uncharacterized protein